jgi:hypothetical protein
VWDHKNFREIFPKQKKGCIIITTINEPTKQIKFYEKKNNWDLIIVGDSKTNDSAYKDLKCIYLGLKEQQALFPTLYDMIPLKSYTRKMFGYLYAIQKNYEIIYDTDDDNQYTEDLDSFESNYDEYVGSDLPSNDICAIKIEKYDPCVINTLLCQNNASSFTFDKRNNLLYLKHSQAALVNHANCISGVKRSTKTTKGAGFVNLYKVFTNGNIWPRGIPPNHSSCLETPVLTDDPVPLTVSVIQGLVNNDPDVDAFYRININSGSFFFEKKQTFDVVLDKYAVCPFNTQNTFWNDPSMFYAMYLPVTVTFRYTDILRGFIALYQLWKNNKTIKFTFPTAIQERNEHDLQKDLESEKPMYETAEQVLNLLNTNKDASIEDMYKVLCDNKIVTSDELAVLNEWLRLISDSYPSITHSR